MNSPPQEVHEDCYLQNSIEMNLSTTWSSYDDLEIQKIAMKLFDGS